MRTPKCLVPVALLAASSVAAVRPAAAQEQPAPALPPPADPVLAPPTDPNVAPQAPVVASVPVPATSGTSPALTGVTDHDQVVRRWGIEARRIASLPRSSRDDAACGQAGCLADLNALSLRRWSSHGYAWNLGLALGTGSGKTNTQMAQYTWDTWFGVGPTLGASFLVSNFKHLAVNLSPQLDVLYFMQSGSGPKTWLFDLRALVEGELHTGFIGLPQLSVALSSGLAANFTTTSKPEFTPTGTARRWTIGFTGPQSLWGIVTNLAVRFYF